MKLLDTDVAPLGMGCWAIGGAFYSGKQCLGYSNVHDDVSIRTIHAAMEAGIRLFDTAAVYGAGHSERLLGVALEHRPDALIISKLGMSFDEQPKQVLGDELDSIHVIAAIESSLRRLRRDHIDVMLLHKNSLSADLAMPIFEQMEIARLSGKIRAYGWSTDFPDSVAALAAKEGFIGVEHAMNVYVDVPSMQSTVERHNLVAFIRSPLAMGVLTGKFDCSSTLASDDIRALNSDRRDYFNDGKVAPKHLQDLAAIRELLQTSGRTLSQGALGWLMAKSEKNIPLPGARTVEQIQENALATVLGPLPAEVMAEIEVRLEREPEGKARAR